MLPPSQQAVRSLDFVPSEQFVEQLRQMASESINVFNTFQRHLFDEAKNPFMPEVRTERLHVEPSLQLVHGRLFLDAPGGTRTTFLTSAIRIFLEAKAKNVVTMACSAVATPLLDDAQTAHSDFQIWYTYG